MTELAVRGRFLGIIEPCLPSPAKAPPSGPGWIHEIKHDGFRIMARRDDAGIRLLTRNGNDFTNRFPIIVAAVTALSARSFLIDGEFLLPLVWCRTCDGDHSALGGLLLWSHRTVVSGGAVHVLPPRTWGR